MGVYFSRSRRRGAFPSLDPVRQRLQGRPATLDSRVSKDPPSNLLGPEICKSCRVEYDVIAHYLRRIPARLSVYEALQLSKEARDALINALVNENIRATYLAQQAEILECSETVTFTDDDMMLGEKQHNRPLFVSGDLAGERIGRILLDPGSAVNILLLKTLERVGFTPSQLKDPSLTIHGFNSGGQGYLGTILLDLDIQGFLTQVNCHVIDAPTSYNLLLGRP